jgi:hypothetical protein
MMELRPQHWCCFVNAHQSSNSRDMPPPVCVQSAPELSHSSSAASSSMSIGDGCAISSVSTVALEEGVIVDIIDVAQIGLSEEQEQDDGEKEKAATAARVAGEQTAHQRSRIADSTRYQHQHINSGGSFPVMPPALHRAPSFSFLAGSYQVGGSNSAGIVDDDVNKKRKSSDDMLELESSYGDGCNKQVKPSKRSVACLEEEREEKV